MVSFLGNSPESELLDAALAVAQDPTATTESRVVALMGIFSLRRPMFVARYDELAHTLDQKGQHIAQCSSGIIAGGGTESRLSKSAEEKVGAAVRRILSDRRVPVEVRSAASCVGW
jgi:hypothetical protein